MLSSIAPWAATFRSARLKAAKAGVEATPTRVTRWMVRCCPSKASFAMSLEYRSGASPGMKAAARDRRTNSSCVTMSYVWKITRGEKPACKHSDSAHLRTGDPGASKTHGASRRSPRCVAASHPGGSATNIWSTPIARKRNSDDTGAESGGYVSITAASSSREWTAGIASSGSA